MGTKKSDLVEKIKRRIGYPTVKIEMEDTTILDHIDYTRDKFIKWAVGQSTQEFYCTLMLSAGQTTYDLNQIDPNIVNVLGYSASTTGSIHTLFTVENYLYQQGMYDQILMRGGGDGYTMVSYEIARGFIDTIQRIIVDAYNFVYHRYTNTLEIHPTPPSGGYLTTAEGDSFNTPGFILLRTYRIEGTDEDIFTNLWVIDYATAMCKMTLGRIRQKFASYASIGSNTGLTLDGDSLLAEGREELNDLETRLRDEEAYDGYGFLIG